MQPVGWGATTVVEPNTNELWKVPTANSLASTGNVERLMTPIAWHGLHCWLVTTGDMCFIV
jgi:hypothetical protein